jgi:peptidoglycan/LPS O-acetylase OafA/YrhL
MHYRPEIDGLRALAVLPVILFHAGFSAFSGGFIGVDVFFVISGYLITSIILSELARGEFSLRRFYARRARRILPALFCVMLVTIPFALLWMLPSQYAAFSRSMLAVVGFVSNLFFWRESGYFAAEASEKPLLHTWSLGVEEQYYVLVPLALMLLWRFGKKPAFYGVVLAAIVSFGLCEYASRYAHSANFFLLPTRAWELLIGSLCAFHHHGRAPKQNNLLALLGLSMVTLAVFTYGEHMRLPSAYTLAPVIGTALILLYATRDTWVAKMLSLKLCVGIGLISYSAYLWHHPLFAFAHIRLFHAPSAALMLGLSALALLLGALTWWLVEQPFRQKNHRFYVGNRAALCAGIATALLLVGAGIYGHVTDGRLAYWQAHAPENQRLAYAMIDRERTRNFDYDNGDCIFNANSLTQEVGERMAGCAKKHGKGIAIIGDSHAMNMFHVLKTRAGTHRFVVGLGQGMCRPHAPLATCNYQPLQALLQQHPAMLHTIIYEQAGWHLFVDARGREIDQDRISGLPLNVPVPNFTPNHAHIDAVAAYLKTLAPFARVIWLGPRIEPAIAENIIIHLGCDYPFALRPNQAEIFEQLDAAIARQLTGTGIEHHSQIATLALDMRHDFMSCDATYWKDRNHYSEEGERHFGERLTLDRVLTNAPISDAPLGSR